MIVFPPLFKYVFCTEWSPHTHTHTHMHVACDGAASAGGVHVGGVGVQYSLRMASISSQDGL